MKKIILDIGHGGSDSGALANGLVEKEINLRVGLLVRTFLNKYECEVGMTRENDIFLSADKRAEIVKGYNPNLCVSIHHNSAANEEARGVEVIHAHYDSYDDRLALRILNEMAAIGMPARRAFTRLNDRGSDWYFMIRRIWDENTQAIITEGGFLTNPLDAELLKADSFLESEAKAIADSIAWHLELKPAVVVIDEKLRECIKRLHSVTPQVIQVPEYWVNNAVLGGMVKGEYAAQLICNMSEYIETKG